MKKRRTSRGDGRKKGTFFAAVPVVLTAALWVAAVTPEGALWRAVAVSGALMYPAGTVAAAQSYMQSRLGEGDAHAADPPAAKPSSAETETVPAALQAKPAADAGDPIDAGAETAIPAERRLPIEQSRFYSRITGDAYFDYGNACVRNATDYPISDMQTAAAGELGFAVELYSDEPQVLIMHTHSTESFDPYDCGWYDSAHPTRSTDGTNNITAVGETLCDELNALGINAVHAPEYHDYPNYNNSYSRSAETVKKYLAQHPSIKVVLDIHRDGMQREDGTRVKPTVEVDGRKAAQIMIVSGADDGTMGMPLFRENLKFAVRLGDAVETLYEGLSRPIYLAYRHYNQDLTTGSLLIEVGSEANTLEEAKYTACLVARALAYCFGADVQP